MITHDGSINIATGLSKDTRVWKNKKILYSEFVQKLSHDTKTNETHKEFLAATKDEQSKIKDVGGYVGGYLRNGKRSPANVVHRQVITLDIDFAHVDFWSDFTLIYDNSAVLHATHKHCESDPRYRLIMPLSRECSADEYVAISRQVAGSLGIELFDNTTFEPNRLMFWPSTPRDMEYYFECQDGPWLDADKVLSSYIDWKDTSLWPTADRKLREIGDNAKKQQDPAEKKGIIGAFCRTFTISEVIEGLLSDVYTPATEGRYTYVKGTTAAGLILYNDLFAYSHHGTDPCGGKLCNAFDLVRIHLFGHLDSTEESANPTKQKSFVAMEEFARKNPEVKKTIARESLTDSKYDFAEPIEEQEVLEATIESSVDWMTELETDTKGNYLSTANNLNVIFANDPRLKGNFRQNSFDAKRYVFATLPWRKVTSPEPVKNVDYSGVRNYIESIYGISGTLKIEDSLALEFERHTYHPVREYLTALNWDGTSRIDNLLIDYFGAEDNVYSREAIRKMLVGAVARIFRPGCKFDLVLILVGKQGTKKSSFIMKLGKAWFSDTFMTVQGKEALEQIQGAWLIEMAELAGLRKAEVESIKHFISKQEDNFRPAYARTSETFLRQCVFFGTTNKDNFLQDPTGNRRFMPIDVHTTRVAKDVFTELDSEVDQIWAEAVALYRAGERLRLSDEAEAIAIKEQITHSETDERRGLLEQYLNARLPQGWDTLGLFERRDYVAGQSLIPKGTTEREFVCIAEIWCECLGKAKEDMSRYNTREINDIMRSFPEWDGINSTKNFPLYGKQKYYRRKINGLF